MSGLRKSLQELSADFIYEWVGVVCLDSTQKIDQIAFRALIDLCRKRAAQNFFGENMWSESRRSDKRRRIAVMIIAIVTEWLPVRPRKSVVRSKRGRYEKQKGQAFVRASSLLCSPYFLCRLRVGASGYRRTRRLDRES